MSDNSSFRVRSADSAMRMYEAGLLADAVLRDFCKQVMFRDQLIAELQQQVAELSKPKKRSPKKEDTDEG